MTSSSTPSWVWLPEPPTTDTLAHVGLFRRSFSLDTAPSTGAPVVVEISADSRYRMWVNGHHVSLGPAKGSDREWYLDTVDIGPWLSEGVNVLAVEVLRYSPEQVGNVSVWRTPLAGLYVRGPLAHAEGPIDDALPTLSTDEHWRCRLDPRRAFHQGRYTYLIGAQETTSGSADLAHWREADFNESDWDTVVPVRATTVDEPLLPWHLSPRPIPAITYEPGAFATVREASSMGDASSVGNREVAAGVTAEFDMDAGELMVGYPQVRLAGGRGARVELLAAECYERPREHPDRRNKGDRTDAANGDLYGDVDVYQVAGYGTREAPEVYETWWLRTFRYLRVRIIAGDEPVRLLGVDYHQSGYPLQVHASFTSDADRSAQLWEVSVRTLRRCLRETFEDCPYYEQLQYAMDTRAQALFMLYLTGDDRLARKAIRDFALSITAEGLTVSRTPSYSRQIIPGFSLYWVMMLHDHLRLVGDIGLVAEHLGRVDTVLAAFERTLEDDGLLGPLPLGQWGYVDWTREWQAHHGVPDPGASSLGSTPTLQYAVALGNAADLAQACGRDGVAQEYRRRAAACVEAVMATCMDAESGLVADFPGRGAASQHAQVWAVLAGAVTGDDARVLLERMLAHHGLAECSYSMSLYRVEALVRTGLGARVDWSAWHAMLEVNLTTWMEDPVSQRSDCHAWGAVPLYHYPAHVLGVRPASDGFTSVLVEPVYETCSQASGAVPTPQGLVEVAWVRSAQGSSLQVRAPEGAPLEVVRPDGVRVLTTGSVDWDGLVDD